MRAPPTAARPHSSQWGSKSHMLAIRQCNILERPVAIEQSPGPRETRVPYLLPGAVHIVGEEILDSLGISRTYKIVYEDLKVLHGGC